MKAIQPRTLTRNSPLNRGARAASGDHANSVVTSRITGAGGPDQLEHRVEQRRLDALPVAGPRSRDEGHDDGRRAEERGEGRGHRQGRIDDVVPVPVGRLFPDPRRTVLGRGVDHAFG